MTTPTVVEVVTLPGSVPETLQRHGVKVGNGWLVYDGTALLFYRGSEQSIQGLKVKCDVDECRNSKIITIDTVLAIDYDGLTWRCPSHYYGPFDFYEDIQRCDWCGERTGNGVNFNHDRQQWQPICSACSERLAWAYNPEIGLSFS